ncbi:hypothetical protein UFOVP1119_121 [uncultured Caudovirales phage]|uniref:Uncharacterized protein n=1 Tax=uncultured Caudovirales phage TaxID=2100421 RepID=A0A6J5QYL0_9CAUD|nr:hypothetical protein UFOVP1119_121 [uncultured Caudovirales phage]CAB4193542.1 hypothetical protein UFOVP1238_95 [uncultured Caudovirales phage]
MGRKTRGNTVQKSRYFYLNDKLHKVLRRSRAEDLLIAWDYQASKRVAYSLTDVNKNKQHAYSISEVVKIIGRHEDTIKMHLYKGNLEYPQRVYSLNGNRTPGKYYWSEDDIRRMHDFFKTVHKGRPRLDGGITPLEMPSRAEVEAMMKQENILYVKNNDGEFVPVWKQPEW